MVRRGDGGVLLMRAAAILDAPSQSYENLFLRPGLENYSLASLPVTGVPGGFGAYAGTTPNAITQQIVASSWAQSGRAFRMTWTTRSVANGDIGLSFNNTGNGVAAARWPELIGQRITAVWDVMLSNDNAWNGITITGVTGGTVTQNAAISGVNTIKAGVPTRVWVTFTIGVGVTNITSIRVNLQNLPLTAGVWAEISNVQLYLGDYVPARALGVGTLKNWQWSGTAGSSSSRGYPYPELKSGPQLRSGSKAGSTTGTSATITLPDNWTASDFLLLLVNSNYTQTLTFPTRVDAFTQLATSGPPIAAVSGGPTYVSGSGAAAGSGSSVTVTAPASIAAGNLLIAIIYMANTGTATYSAPSGWTLAGSIGQFSGTGQGAVYTKTATASEPTSYTFSTFVAFACAVVLQYAGATGLDGAPLFTRVSTSTTSFASPSQTPAAGDGKVVAFGSFNGNTFTASGPDARASARAANAESLYAFDALSSPAASYTATCSTSDTGLAISLLLAPAVGTSTPGDPNAGLLQAFRLTPTAGSVSAVVNVVTNGIIRWWCGAYTQASLTAAVAAAANNIGNNTTAAIAAQAVSLGRVALGNEVYIAVASVNSSATWATSSDMLYSDPSGNAVMAIKSGLVPPGQNSFTPGDFDRGLEGTTRNESVLSLIIPAA
jgi:hypothetical protein